MLLKVTCRDRLLHNTAAIVTTENYPLGCTTTFLSHSQFILELPIIHSFSHEHEHDEQLLLGRGT